jgi:hypothetical protein
MINLSGIQLSYLEFSLTLTVLLCAVLTLLSLRRIRLLESRLVQIQIGTAREINMVNQGAIGIGRRFARIEKNLKKPSNVARFDSAKEPKATKSEFKDVVRSVQEPKPEKRPAVNSMSSGISTRAEQALSAWINEHKTA